MTKKELMDRYFDWMIHLIRTPRTHTYKKLLTTLNNNPFSYSLDLDENRYVDGLELRYRFAEVSDIPYHIIDTFLKNEQCTLLEMMIALALRCEEQIMSNTEKGDRIPVWFWSMISSLRLDSMTDVNFDPSYVNSMIYIFLNRDYSPDGRGSLFTIFRPTQDMRKVEIWYQACTYLNECIAREENHK